MKIGDRCPSPNRGRVYLDGFGQVDLSGYAKELTAAGYWVDSQKSVVKILPQELLTLASSDILIAWPVGCSPLTWVKIGYASAVGIRVVGVYDNDRPEYKHLFIERFRTWEELSQNHFLALGSIRRKKPEIGLFKH